MLKYPPATRLQLMKAPWPWFARCIFTGRRSYSQHGLPFFGEDLVPSPPPSINSDLKSGVSRFTSPEIFFNLMASIFETQKRFFKSSAIGCCHTVFKMLVFSC